MKNLNVSVIVKWAEINGVHKRYSMYDFKRIWFLNLNVKIKLPTDVCFNIIFPLIFWLIPKQIECMIGKLVCCQKIIVNITSKDRSQ